MDRGVSVLRCKKTGNFILNPMGTFRGYGAYVGIYPYREVPADATDQALGEAITQLLTCSGPTGFHISEHDAYKRQATDEETDRVRAEYGFGEGMTTSKFARRFLNATVELRHRQKSWVVQAYVYDSRRRSLSGQGQTPVRVRHSAGVSTLGEAVKRVLG
jgi:hypothetical protein